MVLSRSLYLDAVRGVAAIGVFVFHAWMYTLPVPITTNRSAPAEFVVHELRLGLTVFFVLSGFLLYGPFAKAVAERGRMPAVGTYFKRRAARIMPAYYAALIGSIALLWSLDDEPGVRLPPAETLPLFALFAQNQHTESVMKLDPPMWSLGIEVSFYLVLPVIGWAALRLGGGRLRQMAVPLALAAVGMAWNVWLAEARPGLIYVKSLPTWLPYFAAGMLAAIALVHFRPGRQARRALVAGGLALIAGDALWHAVHDAAGTAGHMHVVLRDVPAAIGAALLITGLAGGQEAAARRPGRTVRALAFMGVISYGFYLWQVPVLLWLRANGLLPLDPVAGVVIGGGVSLALAVASWRWLERPVIERARRRSRRVRAAGSRVGRMHVPAGASGPAER